MKSELECLRELVIVQLKVIDRLSMTAKQLQEREKERLKQ